MHTLSVDKCRWNRYGALYLCQPRHKTVYIYRQVSWLCNIYVQCGQPRIFLMLPKHPSNSSSQPAPGYHCQWPDQWVGDEVASSLMQLDICILRGWVLNDRCLCIHGWHQCLSVDHHSFQDGESACKEECHQHTLKSLIPQIGAPGTHNWRRSKITKDLRRILVVPLTTLDLF